MHPFQLHAWSDAFLTLSQSPALLFILIVQHWQVCWLCHLVPCPEPLPFGQHVTWLLQTSAVSQAPLDLYRVPPCPPSAFFSQQKAGLREGAKPPLPLWQTHHGHSYHWGFVFRNRNTGGFFCAVLTIC